MTERSFGTIARFLKELASPKKIFNLKMNLRRTHQHNQQSEKAIIIFYQIIMHKLNRKISLKHNRNPKKTIITTNLHNNIHEQSCIKKIAILILVLLGVLRIIQKLKLIFKLNIIRLLCSFKINQ